MPVRGGLTPPSAYVADSESDLDFLPVDFFTSSSQLSHSDSLSNSTMTPTTRHSVKRRYVSDTPEPSSSTSSTTKRRRRSPNANTEGEAQQSRVGATPNNDNGTSSRSGASAIAPIEIEDIDEDSALNTTLQRQRAEQVASQQPHTEKPLRLSNLTCVICMDTPTDLTATSCGHIFCYTCLMEALIAGENRLGAHGETKKSQCPVCRKAIARNKASDVIPLLIKKKVSLPPSPKKHINETLRKKYGQSTK
jgi:hypothetical protein